MRIQHNIMAMSSYRNFNNNTSALSKNLEKLSSGYRINRAGDDAAGLAISEKMRAQITGLDAAQKNVKDGISLVKTAEGAMQEIQDMMNRMKYLATQSANGTYQDEVDRENLQKEVDALKTEINRIADSSNFNGKQLLDGSLSPSISGASDVTVTAVADAASGVNAAKGKYEIDLSQFEFTSTNAGSQTVNITVGGQNVMKLVGVTGGQTYKGSGFVTAATQVTIDGNKFNISLSGSKVVLEMASTPTKAFSDNMEVAITGNKLDLNNDYTKTAEMVTEPVVAATQKEAQGSFTLTNDMVQDGNKIQIGEDIYTFKVGKDSKVAGSNVIDLSSVDSTNATALLKAAGAALGKVNNSQFDITSNNAGSTIYLTSKKAAVLDNDLAGTAANATDGNWKGLVKWAKAGSGESTTGLTLQIGDTADAYNQLTVAIDDMHTDALGIGNLDISTLENAQESIEKITSAINKVSQTRGDLGAVQNRLEHTANNLSVMEENIQDAESTIRDTDMADEMTAYTKNNILVQAAQAMLAQANQQPQGVLQLLQ